MNSIFCIIIIIIIKKEFLSLSSWNFPPEVFHKSNSLPFIPFCKY